LNENVAFIFKADYYFYKWKMKAEGATETSAQDVSTNTVASHSALQNRHYHATDFKQRWS
jgi:hypothetical protein